MTFVSNLKKVLLLPLLAIIAYELANFIYKVEVPAIASLSLLPFAFLTVWLLFSKPQTGIILTLVISIVINGIGRYVSAPFSVVVDGLLLSAFVASLFHSRMEDLKRLSNPAMWMIIVWTLYTIFEIFNPQSISFEAWFFAVRSISLYMCFLSIITLLVLNEERFLNLFIKIWCIGGIAGALHGIKQAKIGLDSYETIWINTIGADTHILFGKIRIFSFFSDAGQFGAFMSFTSLVGFILAVKEKDLKTRLFYLFTGLVCGYGMLISGTRGALFVYTGSLVYLLLVKNFRILSVGFFIVGVFYFILRFTYIGAGNYDIQRMRSAVKPSDDPSYLVRKENQRKLAVYLADKPFGGGVGSSGYWGTRFRPGSFLAETPTDSWYVRIWVETGQVGLYLYLIVFGTILGYCTYLIWNMYDPVLKQKVMAIFSGCAGILIASYGNQLIGQFPTMIFFSVSIPFIYLAFEWDKQRKIEAEALSFPENEIDSQQQEDEPNCVVPG